MRTFHFVLALFVGLAIAAPNAEPEPASLTERECLPASCRASGVSATGIAEILGIFWTS
jgi:hypothetical protein